MLVQGDQSWNSGQYDPSRSWARVDLSQPSRQARLDLWPKTTCLSREFGPDRLDRRPKATRLGRRPKVSHLDN